MRNVLRCVSYDCKELGSLQAPPDVFECEYQQAKRTKKEKEKQQEKRKYTPRTVVSGKPQDLFEKNSDYEKAKSSVPQRSLYTLFTETMLTRGTIVWRNHTGEKDLIVLSDYCEKSGQVKALDFVHVEASYPDVETVLMTCSCKIYKYMQGRALKMAHLQRSQDAVLDENFTCMHCRFFKEFMYPIRNSFGDPERTSQLHQKIQSSLGGLNNPLILIGSANSNSTTKFSAWGQDWSSFVHIHFGPQGCYARCQSGMCKALGSHIRTGNGLPKGVSLDVMKDNPLMRHSKDFCAHLVTLYSNLEVLYNLFPDYFGPQEEEDDEEEEEGRGHDDLPDIDPDNFPVEPDLVNYDDRHLRGYDSGKVYFDPYWKEKGPNGEITVGKWVTNSFSQYEPKFDRFDPALVKSCAQRIACINGELTPEGFYKGPPLSVPDEDGPCMCGAGYSSEGTAHVTRQVKVYTRQVCIWWYIG